MCLKSAFGRARYEMRFICLMKIIDLKIALTPCQGKQMLENDYFTGLLSKKMLENDYFRELPEDHSQK